MTDKDPLLCSLCYSSLKDSPSIEKVPLNKRTLILCATCSNQADQISQNTGASRQAAIAYMVELIFSALTSAAPPNLPRPSPRSKKAKTNNHGKTHPDHT